MKLRAGGAGPHGGGGGKIGIPLKRPKHSSLIGSDAVEGAAVVGREIILKIREKPRSLK